MINRIDVPIEVEGNQTTLREIIWDIGCEVLLEQDSFSGKYPFGDSDFYWNVRTACEEAGMIPVSKSWKTFDNLIKNLTS